MFFSKIEHAIVY